MHLFHIYYKIKNWIHGDDRSYELMKIVQVYGKWMMKIYPFMKLSPLYLEDIRTWLSLLLLFLSCPFSMYFFLVFNSCLSFSLDTPLRSTGERDYCIWSFILWMDGME
jgi:hypothetical protein